MRTILAALVLLQAACAGAAHAQVELRLSFKLIYDDSVSPSVPPGSAAHPNDHCREEETDPAYPDSPFSCEAEIRRKVDYVNGLLDRMGRRFRLVVVEVVPLVDPPDPPPSVGASAWSLAPDLGAVEQDLQDAANADPETWAWRDDAANFYVFDTPGGGYSDNRLWNDLNTPITLGQSSKGTWTRILHELGHYLGLYHTFGHAIGGGMEIGRDDICDTIVDTEEGTLDSVTANYFGAGTTYASLASCLEQQQVLDVWFNIMSYHADDDHADDCRDFDIDSVQCGAPVPADGCRHRLTKDQLDRIAVRLNSLNGPGIAVGETLFVDATPAPACDFAGCNDSAQSCPHDPASAECACTQAPRMSDGTTTFLPYTTVDAALLESQLTTTRDVVVVRGGVYDEAPLIDHAVTLTGGSGDAQIRELP